MLSVERWSAEIHRDQHLQKQTRRRLIPTVFGRGGLPDYPDFYDLPEPEQTYYLLYQNGCRVPYDSMIKNGEGWMRLRAGETNFFFSWILKRAKELNKPLYRQLSKPQKRRRGEDRPDGVYESYTGPRDNKDYIYPLQGIYGYASSRIFIEIMGRRDKRTQSLFLNATDILDNVIKESKSRGEFVARLTGRGFENGAGAIPMLSHLLPNGILTEQNCFTDYRDLAHDLSIHAPKVWSAYQDAHPDVLVMNDIAPMSRFISSE